MTKNDPLLIADELGDKGMKERLCAPFDEPKRRYNPRLDGPAAHVRIPRCFKPWQLALLDLALLLAVLAAGLFLTGFHPELGL